MKGRREGNSTIRLEDRSPGTAEFLHDVLAGLRKDRKQIPTKYLYDERGSKLFEKICAVEEYYPTRTEIAILREHGRDMAAHLGPRCMVVEPGSGAGIKTRMLLDLLEDPVAFVPVEISMEFLTRSVRELADAFPKVRMLPVCADFTAGFDLPANAPEAARVVAYFPGSTIGNFPSDQSLHLLRRLASICGATGAVLIGVDLKKDRATVEAAYNDRGGVTAAFNLNLLVRINRELDADFDLDGFRHLAFWNDAIGAIEVHIESLRAQTVRIGDERFDFREGETIHTEYSCKYSLDEFARIAAKAGLRVDRVWTDPERLFSVQLLVPA